MINKRLVIFNLLSGLVFGGIVVWVNWSAQTGIIHKLCDGCFVAGVLLMGAGGLKYFRNQGAFDIMAFGIKSAFTTAFPWSKSNSPLENREEQFVEYKERKRAERKPAGDLLIAGGVYLALALILLAVWSFTG